MHKIPDELVKGLEQFLFNNFLEDITILAEKGEENKISINKGVCCITYTDKAYFFRALSIIKGKTDGFCMCENKKIKNLGVQLDLSRNGALTVSAIKRYMDYMAAMGMNRLYLYMEDMFCVPERKYFGYLRGRYSEKELKEIDDYGYNYGIEVVPSIQVLGHHFQYLKWEEANDVKDTASELLSDSDLTYEFIESMIKSVLKSFRTKKILLGMDETHTLGLGNYLKNNGYKDAKAIFLKHLENVFEIVKKLGLEGMIYSDMIFKMASDKNYYYEKNAVIDSKFEKNLPENLTLVYWHYGEEFGCDDFMLEKHKSFNRKTIFFGGSWTWSGHLPETSYALNCTELALKSCEKHNIDEVIITVWGDNGNECSHFYSLLTMQYVAEFIYQNENEYKKRFEDVTGAEAQSFIDMSAYQNIFDEDIKYSHFSERFKGRTFFWQDILMGQADSYLKDNHISKHYKKYADKFLKYAEKDGVWKKHYEYISSVLRVLEHKCYIAENIQTAYKNNDKKGLTEILNLLKNELLNETKKCHALHKELWFESCKPFGFEVIDIRYGGLKARIKTTSERLEKYIEEEINSIEELEEERLEYKFSPFTPYKNIATASYEF